MFNIRLLGNPPGWTDQNKSPTPPNKSPTPPTTQELFKFGFSIADCLNATKKTPLHNFEQKIKEIEVYNVSNEKFNLHARHLIENIINVYKNVFIEHKENSPIDPQKYGISDMPVEMIAALLEHVDAENAINFIKAINHLKCAPLLLANFMNKKKLPVTYLDHFPELFFQTFSHLTYVDFRGWGGDSDTIDICLKKIDTISELILNDDYNQPFPEGLDLSTLQSLTFGRRYNQPFPNDLILSAL